MILPYLILGSKEVIVRWCNGMDALRWNGEFTGEYVVLVDVYVQEGYERPERKCAN